MSNTPVTRRLFGALLWTGRL